MQKSVRVVQPPPVVRPEVLASLTHGFREALDEGHSLREQEGLLGLAQILIRADRAANGIKASAQDYTAYVLVTGPIYSLRPEVKESLPVLRFFVKEYKEAALALLDEHASERERRDAARELLPLLSKLREMNPSSN